MKHLITKFTRWRLPRRSRLIGVAAALLFFAISAQAQGDAILPPIGGRGGSQFVARCQQGQHLTGFELRIGDDIDAIRPICVTAYGRAEAGPLEPYPSKFGGTGGGADLQLLCPRDNPIVVAIYVRAEGVNTVSVNNIHLFCGVAAATQWLSQYKNPSAVYDGPRDMGRDTPEIDDKQYCPAGLVAVGINGRSGIYVDSLGLICGAPRVTPKTPPVKDDGMKPPRRVPSGGLQPSGPICELARNARARNSPAAPGLEAQCAAERAALNLDGLAARGAAIANEDPLTVELRNQQPEGRARHGFDIGMAAAEGHTAPGPGKQKIHDHLSPVEREGFSTAVSFSLARNRRTLADLADKGAAIALQDPLAAELRKQQPNDPARRGFDVGMAAAEGHTAPGPGKDRIRDSLPLAEQGGFTTAVTFSLERNRQKIADLADKGAAIAEEDSIVAETRNVESDVAYRQGFDIATAIFGDPALGAKGDTARGPGSLGIRDTLTARGQRGFNDSVTLHLSRNYKRTSASITVRDAVGTNPGTVYTAGQPQRIVDVDWNAGSDHADCEIHLSVDNGQWSEFATGRDGTKPATIKLGSSHTFRMMVYENQEGPPRFIAVLTIIGEQGNPPPAANASPNGTSGTATSGSTQSANDLAAAKGQAIAKGDPLAAELRDRHPEGPARRGFDIGMAAAEGHTLPGPGKDRIRESLRLDKDGGDVAARAFNTAVSFSIERNANADLAAAGAAIADLDPTVADARITEPDVLYRLGFDIATGLFGDPAKGAQGNTATGPGSLRIRDSLSAAGQRGFNASVKLHLSRKY